MMMSFLGVPIMVWDVPDDVVEPAGLRLSLANPSIAPLMKSNVWDAAAESGHIASLMGAFEIAARRYLSLEEGTRIEQLAHVAVMKSYQFTPPHRHYFGELAAVYYVSDGRPAEVSTCVLPIDGIPSSPGSLILMDCHSQVGKPSNMVIRVRAGRMVMFPSSIYHYSIPHEGDDFRMHVSNNLRVFRPVSC